jgi:GrpB-like predicted nucleotidyltransferase (UPF0157 family)
VSSEADSLGLESGVVVVVPYDPRWSGEFVAASAAIRDALGSDILAIHHVGSTAVPGLCAKPILDLLVSVADLERSLDLVPALEELGYEFRSDEEIPDRHYFRRGAGMVRTHHLSLAEPASHYHRVTVAFRDALRANPVKAREYCELKMTLAREYPMNRAKYIEGKSAFVAGILAAASLGAPRVC